MLVAGLLLGLARVCIAELSSWPECECLCCQECKSVSGRATKLEAHYVEIRWALGQPLPAGSCFSAVDMHWTTPRFVAVWLQLARPDSALGFPSALRFTPPIPKPSPYGPPLPYPQTVTAACLLPCSIWRGGGHFGCRPGELLTGPEPRAAQPHCCGAVW